MQTKMELYLHKKTINQRSKLKNQDHHDSSRQNSQTEPLQSREQQNHKPNIQYNKKTITCIAFFLNSPPNSIYFDKIHKKLVDLKSQYNPTKKIVFYKYIEHNLNYNDKKFNIDNLKLIQDNLFWKQTLPKMITYFLDNHKQMIGIQTLFSKKAKHSSSVVLTRSQVLLIMISLFFGIMPKSQFTHVRSFGEFMTNHKTEDKGQIRFEKLKFIINYFNIAIEKIHSKRGDSTFEYQTVTFQKYVSQTVQIRNDLNPEKTYGRDPPLMDVQFSDKPGMKIQDYYGHAAMVDFANSSIGGGALKKGSVQEEILFLVFPEAYISMFLVPEMLDNESIAIYGLRKFSTYKNYSYNMKFDGAYENDDLEEFNKSVMIAIDATNFYQSQGQDYQFTKENTLRQIAKAITGFSTLSESNINEVSDLKICTGRWGCGAFNGDEIWKFFIQWIACSYTERSMIYLSDQEDIVKEIKQTVRRLVGKGLTVLDLYSMMEDFMRVKRRFIKPTEDHTFIDFLKSQYVL